MFLSSAGTNIIKRVGCRTLNLVDKLKADRLVHFILPAIDKITTGKDYNNEDSFPTLENEL